MNYLDIEKANQLYRHDAEFSRLVHSMIELMKRLHLSPAELRCVATFAAIRFEMSRPVEVRAADLGLEKK